MVTTNPLRTQFTIDVTELTEDDRAALARVVASFFTQLSAPADGPEPSSWTLPLYENALHQLAAGRALVQIAAIKRAIANGGSISRAEVYELGHYEASRSLKGFTRPVNRIVNAMIEAGTLPEDAEELLTPDYDADVSGYQRARGFAVPPEIVRLARS